MVLQGFSGGGDLDNFSHSFPCDTSMLHVQHNQMQIAFSAIYMIPALYPIQALQPRNQQLPGTPMFVGTPILVMLNYIVKYYPILYEILNYFFLFSISPTTDCCSPVCNVSLLVHLPWCGEHYSTNSTPHFSCTVRCGLDALQYLKAIEQLLGMGGVEEQTEAVRKKNILLF